MSARWWKVRDHRLRGAMLVVVLTTTAVAFTGSAASVAVAESAAPTGAVIFTRTDASGLPIGIWGVERDGTGLRQIRPSGRFPRWSPNGRRIAFVDADIDLTGGNQFRVDAVFTMDSDGGNVTRESHAGTFDGFTDSKPRWRGDGSLSWLRAWRDAVPGVYASHSSLVRDDVIVADQVGSVDPCSSNLAVLPVVPDPHGTSDRAAWVRSCRLPASVLSTVDVYAGTPYGGSPVKSATLFGADVGGWSPNGQQLAVTTSTADAVSGVRGLLVDVSTGQESVLLAPRVVTLTDGGSPCQAWLNHPTITDWASDGDLAISGYVTNLPVGVAGTPCPSVTYTGVWLVKPDGTNLRTVSSGRGEGVDASLQCLPGHCATLVKLIVDASAAQAPDNVFRFAGDLTGSTVPKDPFNDQGVVARVSPGTLAIQQLPASGWSPVSIACTRHATGASPEAMPATMDSVTGLIRLSVAEGDDAECVLAYTNGVPPPDDGDDDDDPPTITFHADFPPGAGSDAFVRVVADDRLQESTVDVSLTKAAPTLVIHPSTGTQPFLASTLGWLGGVLRSVVCDDPDFVGTRDNDYQTTFGVQVSAGENVSCTITMASGTGTGIRCSRGDPGVSNRQTIADFDGRLVIPRGRDLSIMDLSVTANYCFDGTQGTFRSGIVLAQVDRSGLDTTVLSVFGFDVLYDPTDQRVDIHGNRMTATCGQFGIDWNWLSVAEQVIPLTAEEALAVNLTRVLTQQISRRFPTGAALTRGVPQLVKIVDERVAVVVRAGLKKLETSNRIVKSAAERELLEEALTNRIADSLLTKYTSEAELAVAEYGSGAIPALGIAGIAARLVGDLNDELQSITTIFVPLWSPVVEFTVSPSGRLTVVETGFKSTSPWRVAVRRT